MTWNELQINRLALIAYLCANAQKGSLGRTALMKLCYFLQVLRGVPLGYRFTLYSYGPFDSDVLSDLDTAESFHAVESSLEVYSGGYGYSVRKGERGDKCIQAGQTFLANNREAIDWVLSEFGSLSSVTLELRATIVYVDREAMMKSRAISKLEMVRQVHDVKPHFPEETISAAVDTLSGKGLLHSLAASAQQI
jgi:hypothetical protein